jgi:hypothetical protein
MGWPDGAAPTLADLGGRAATGQAYDGAVSDLGVVDPIRVPAPIADGISRQRRLPMVAQVFVGLTVLDALARTIGLIEPAVGGNLVGLFSSYVPRDAWILLPALVLVRRPSAQTDTPWVVRGSIVIALVTLLTRPTLAIVGDLLPVGAVEPYVALAVVESVLRGIEYAVLGIGLATVNPRPPRPVSAGLGNLAAIGVIVAFIALLVGSLATNSRVDPLGTALPVWSYIAPFLGGLGIAYLVRAVCRGLDDPNRSERATRIATSGALIWTLGLVAEATLGAVAILAHVFFPSDVFTAFGLLEAAIGPLLLVVAFGLGLADPLRPTARAWDAAAVAPPGATPG